jgi:hypothetical protein
VEFFVDFVRFNHERAVDLLRRVHDRPELGRLERHGRGGRVEDVDELRDALDGEFLLEELAVGRQDERLALEVPERGGVS